MADPASETVLFEGDQVKAKTPEGAEKTMKISELFEQLATQVPDTCGVVLADGVKAALPVQGGLVIVHQTPPQVYNFRWIAADSEAEFGPGTRYRRVRLALPYVIVIAVFGRGGRGGLALTQRNECFFSNEPLEHAGLETPLHYPALLNCSKMASGDGPLSWICTQYLDKKHFGSRNDLDSTLREGLGALLRHTFEAGFNRSSEHHEGASGFSASVDAGIDPRIASVEDWEKATRDDPLFALSVPWLPVGMTLRQITDRIGSAGRGGRRRFASAADIARIVFNPRNRRSRK